LAPRNGTYITTYLDLSSQSEGSNTDWANVGPPGQVLLDADYAYIIWISSVR
jgi:hypothetical protein